MNFYGLPEFVAYGILVGIAVVLIQKDGSAHLRYWLVGWIVVLIHAGIYMLIIPGFIQDILGRGSLAIAGLAFTLAAYYRNLPVKMPRLLRQLGLIGLPNIVFAVASTAYLGRHPDGRAFGPFAILTLIGLACAIWQAMDQAEPGQRSWALAALAVVVYGGQIWSLYAYGVLMASQWLMCWTYLAVAFFFLRQTPKLTMGVFFTALSFVLWGIVFPIYSLLPIYAPSMVPRIESQVWNLPKFLAATSMILVLFEEKVARATRLATHDELTHLPNRRLYQDRFNAALYRARRNNSHFAVLIVDLNRFKQVNDTMGHSVGDELLRTVSARFLGALRQVDTVARTGGDEFSILLDGVGALEEVGRVSRAIQEAMQAPIVLAGRLIDVGVSIGAAIYPDDGKTEMELHLVADGRMYADKEKCRKASAMPGHRS